MYLCIYGQSRTTMVGVVLMRVPDIYERAVVTENHPKARPNPYVAPYIYIYTNYLLDVRGGPIYNKQAILLSLSNIPGGFLDRSGWAGR